MIRSILNIFVPCCMFACYKTDLVSIDEPQNVYCANTIWYTLHLTGTFSNFNFSELQLFITSKAVGVVKIVIPFNKLTNHPLNDKIY